MADLNASYILQGQSPDVVGQLMRGSQAAQQTNQVRQQNALAQLYQTQGAGIMNGDQGALNALAGISPDAAMGVQQNRLGMDSTRLGMQSTRQDMGFQSERMQMARDDATQKAAEYAKGITAAEAAKHAAEVERGVAAAATATTPGQWDQIAQQFGAPELVGQFANRDAVLGSYMGIAEVMKQRSERPDPLKGAPEGQMFVDANNPGAGLVPIPGYTPKPADDYGRYVQEQQAAGSKPLDRLAFEGAKKGNGFSVTTPDGTTVQYGGPSTAKGNPADPAAMVATIDGILTDPALDTSTGILSPLQNIPGTPMKRFQTRTKQLEGQAFLQAFTSLKGGGQITEIEGAKATAAIGRLDSAQSPDDYRQALTELRDILTLAQSRPAGWAQSQPSNAANQPAPAQGSVLQFDADGNLVQ